MRIIYQKCCQLGLKVIEMRWNDGKLLDFWDSIDLIGQRSYLAVNMNSFFKKREEQYQDDSEVFRAAVATTGPNNTDPWVGLSLLSFKGQDTSFLSGGQASLSKDQGLEIPTQGWVVRAAARIGGSEPPHYQAFSSLVDRASNQKGLLQNLKIKCNLPCQVSCLFVTHNAIVNFLSGFFLLEWGCLCCACAPLHFGSR